MPEQQEARDNGNEVITPQVMACPSCGWRYWPEERFDPDTVRPGICGVCHRPLPEVTA